MDRSRDRNVGTAVDNDESDDDTAMAGSPPNPFNFVYRTRGAATAILPAVTRLLESRECIATGLPRFIIFTSNRTDHVQRRTTLTFEHQTADFTTRI